MKCLGWAYETCDSSARWILREHWFDGRWSETYLCPAHLEALFAGVDQEHDAPQYRVWLDANVPRRGE